VRGDHDIGAVRVEGREGPEAAAAATLGVAADVGDVHIEWPRPHLQDMGNTDRML